MLAVICYNAVACGTPADTKKGASTKSKHWKNFMKNLDWNYLEALAEAKTNPKSAVGMFEKLGFNTPKERK